MKGSRALSFIVVVAMTVGAVMSPTGLADAQSHGAWKKDWNVRCSWVDRMLFEATMNILITLFLDMDAHDIVEELFPMEDGPSDLSEETVELDVVPGERLEVPSIVLLHGFDRT